jgi:hypothetical protein
MNLENAAAWSVPAPEPCAVHPCVRCEVLNSDTVTLYLRNVSLDIDGEGGRYEGQQMTNTAESF